jgi:hypothetical protein
MIYRDTTEDDKTFDEADAIGEGCWFFFENEMGQHDIHDDCFCCGKKLSTPSIAWAGHLSGGNASVWLHPKCAHRLAVGLLKDVAILTAEECKTPQ